MSEQNTEATGLSSLEMLTRIFTICKSRELSKDAKLAYVMLAAPNPTGDVNICYCDPPDDVKDGLYELARKGLIRLEIDGYEFRSRLYFGHFPCSNT